MSEGAPRVELLFLWHHHQPDYRSPRGGRSLLPWVRLHASKDYLDMALRLERHPRLKATFNFVPSLLDQLDDAVRGGRDVLFDLLARPVADLTPDERAEVVARCSTPPSRLRDRWPKYAALCRRAERARRDAADAPGLSVRDVEALEAWFLVTWTDPMFHGEPEAAAALAARDHPSAADRDALLGLHRRLLAQVVPAYRRLAERGQVELSASPYAHPILPLLIDTSSAQRALPGLPLPSPGFAARDDARRQLARAIARHAEVWGVPPRGVWPSEGSVSPEAAEVVATAGLRWMATDEGVLWASLRAEARRRGAHYHPWTVATPAGDVAVFFRDRELSDRIGFVYHHWETREAVEDFLARLRRVGDEHAGETPLVCVILDGENCWEHYAQDGGPFLDALYDALDAASDIRTVTPSEVLARRAAPERLTTLHSGSWIDADFHIWIGHPEKNRAWELLARTRADLTAAGATPETQPAAWNALDSAEGSDWFWWLGTDHYTSDKALFERIFREHLQATYEVRGVPVPEWLQVPIVTHALPSRSELEPVGFLSPTLDGRVTSFYEWSTAGRFRVGAGGSMHRAETPIRDLHFGFDAEFLYVRVDFEGAVPGASADLDIAIGGRSMIRIRGLEPGERPVAAVVDDSASVPVAGGRAIVGVLLEAAIPLAAIGLTARSEMSLAVILRDGARELQRVPEDEPLRCVVPGAEDAAATWSA